MRKLLGALAIAGLVAAGCGGDDGEDDAAQDEVTDEVTDETSGDGAGGGEPAIVISGSQFEPAALETEGGTVIVTVTNDDSFPHTFTTDDGSVDEEIAGGEAVEVEVEVDGEVAYHCEIHPSMTGTITG